MGYYSGPLAFDFNNNIRDRRLNVNANNRDDDRAQMVLAYILGFMVILCKPIETCMISFALMITFYLLGKELGKERRLRIMSSSLNLTLKITYNN